jgi:AcrR family transcriptional regulator
MADLTKAQIIKVTLEIIGQYGADKLTIRDLAAKAGVNIGAVNYHFGSKENLVSQAVAFFITETQEAFRILEDLVLSPEERLLRFMESYMAHAIEYPGVIRTLMQELMAEGSLAPRLAVPLKQNAESLKATIRQLNGTEDERLLSAEVVQIMSSLSYPILILPRLKEIYGLEWNTAEEIRRFASLLVKQLSDSAKPKSASGKRKSAK